MPGELENANAAQYWAERAEAAYVGGGPPGEGDAIWAAAAANISLAFSALAGVGAFPRTHYVPGRPAPLPPLPEPRHPLSGPQ